MINKYFYPTPLNLSNRLKINLFTIKIYKKMFPSCYPSFQKLLK